MLSSSQSLLSIFIGGSVAATRSSEGGNELEILKSELEKEGYFESRKPDDITLMRFLRSRKFNVPVAKKLYIDAEKWREEYGVEEIMTKFELTNKSQVQQIYPRYYHGTDLEGRPVYFERQGSLDLKALFKIANQDDLLKHLVKELETTLRCCCVLDLQGATFSSFCKARDFILAAVSMAQNYYPDCMGKCFIINAPFLFTTIWGCVKGWLNEVTVAKIEILGPDYIKTLSKHIPLHNIPKTLGGGCECLGGCSLSDKGPWNEQYVASPIQEELQEEVHILVEESSFSLNDWVLDTRADAYPLENLGPSLSTGTTIMVAD